MLKRIIYFMTKITIILDSVSDFPAKREFKWRFEECSRVNDGRRVVGSEVTRYADRLRVMC